MNHEKAPTLYRFMRLLAVLGLTSTCMNRSPLAPTHLLTMETSEAIDRACHEELFTAEQSELTASQGELSRCLNDEQTVDLWQKRVFERIKKRWPEDYLARGGEASLCLQKLTRGTLLRYLETLIDACLNDPDARNDIRIALNGADDRRGCYDFVRMTETGCFVVESCDGSPFDSDDLGVNQRTEANKAVLCSANIQRIHRLKDPANQNLLYNFAYVSELTGVQSYRRTTYGPPNCHGTAQAAAGGLFDDFILTGYVHARTANESKCKSAVDRFMSKHQNKPISQIPMNPGGILINMQHKDCRPSDCGVTKLWIDQCDDQTLDLSVFIDGMCVDCWEQKLGQKGFTKQIPKYTAEQMVPGCILTTSDHSVLLIGKSQDMCFYYEATTPFGPPQVRATPCVVLNHQFSRQYCSKSSALGWAN